MNDYSPAEQGEIRADLTALYTAGKQTLPDRAQSVSDVATDMSSAIDSANQQSANMGDHPVTRDVLNLAIDCQHGVNRAVTTLNNLAAGVVAVADSYVERDEFARSVFESIRSDLGLSEELGDAESTPVEAPGDHNRDHTLADGAPAGPRVHENPDAQDPTDELDERDNRTDRNQDDIGIPEY